jgi:superfamily II DNA/RNA helicase
LLDQLRISVLGEGEEMLDRGFAADIDQMTDEIERGYQAP